MKSKLFHSLLAVAIVFPLATPLLHAKKVEFPADDPAFTFTMPDSWTTETGPDGRIYCTAPDGFKIGIIASPSVSDTADAKALLPKILKGMADAMKCQNYKTADVNSGEMGKLSLARCRRSANRKGPRWC